MILQLRMAMLIVYGLVVVLGRRLVGKSAARPGWTFRLEVFVFVALFVQRRTAAFPVGTLRRLVDQIPIDKAALASSKIDEVEVAGCHAYRIAPEGKAQQRRMLHFHGGGYIVGNARGCREILCHLGRGLGADVVTVDYRLAPDDPFPAALDDALTAYEEMLEELEEEGRSAADLMVAGESAGGGLALCLMLKLKELGRPLPGMVFCFGPWVQLASDRPSYERNAETDILAQQGIDYARDLYLDGHNPRDPLVSPIFGDLEGLPPVFVLSGEAEVFVDDHRALNARLQRAGVRSELVVEPHMPHTWLYLGQALDGTYAQAEKLGRRLRAFWDDEDHQSKAITQLSSPSAQQVS